MIRLGIYNKTPSKKKEKNGGYYEQATYPREKIQVDVKYVPKKCLSPNEMLKLYESQVELV